MGRHAPALLAVMVVCGVSCGGSPTALFSDSGPPSTGAGGADSGTGGPSGNLGGDATTCSPDQPAEGCACTTAGKSAACWTGPPSQRNVGACHDGTAVCVRSGEFGIWGPCQGEQLTCGVPEAAAPDSAAPAQDGGGTGGMGSEDSGNGNGGMGGEDAGCPPANGVNGCPIGYTNPYCVSSGGAITCTYNGNGPFCCAPCAAADCADPTKAAACCLSAACASAPECQACQGQQLDPLCNGVLASDCDDYPEDCDELCCPCKPAGICPTCPAGQISCAGTCVDASTPQNCGACDSQCFFGQQCIHAQCQ
jgi:hypothetical protein